MRSEKKYKIGLYGILMIIIIWIILLAGIGRSLYGQNISVDTLHLIDTNLTTRGSLSYLRVNEDTLFVNSDTLISGSDGDWVISGNNLYSGVSGNIGIGTTQPQAVFEVQHLSGQTAIFRRVSNNATANPLFLLQRVRGTIGAETAVEDGDRIGQIRFEGYHGSGYGYPAGIIASVDSALSGTTVMGNLTFWTQSHSAYSERMRINRNGNLGIGLTDPDYMLEISENLLADTLFGLHDWDSVYNTPDFLQWSDTTGNLATDYNVSLKQNITDTNSVDATRYWVEQQGYSTTTGTVTSVGLSIPSAEFLVTGSPVTTSGTLNAVWRNQLANKTFIAPDGAVGQPTFRVLIANDVPDHDDLNGFITTKHYYQKDIDTVNNSLTGIAVMTSGLLSAITDNSANWNTAYGWGNHSTAGYLVWSDTLNELATDYDIAGSRFDSLFIDYTNTGFTDGWVKNLGTIKVDTSTSGATGEINTASNVGIVAGDAGVWFDKSGVDLRFREFNSANNILTIAENGTDTVIDFTIIEANIDHNELTNTHNLTTDIDHNQLTNYVATKHYFQKDIDTVNNDLTGIALLTSGVISTITDNSANWNTAYGWGDHSSVGYLEWSDTTTLATQYYVSSQGYLTSGLQWSDTSNELATDYDVEITRFDSLFIDYTNTGFVDGWVKNLGTIKVDTSTSGGGSADADWTISGNNQYSNVSDNVGIGSIVPAQKLDVVGTIEMTGFKMQTAKNDGYVLTSDANGVGTWQALTGGGNVSNTGTPLVNQIAIFTDATTIKGDANFGWTGYTLTLQSDVLAREDITTYSNTATVSSILDVQRSRGTIASPLGVDDGDRLGEIAFVGRNDAGSWNTPVAFHAFAGEDYSTVNYHGVKFGIKHFASGDWVADDDLYGYRILIEDNGDIILNGDNFLASGTLDGNIGISSSAPATKLDVVGVITATGGNSTQWNTAYDRGDWDGGLINIYIPKFNGTNLVNSIITDNGNIGIGTTATKKLDVNGDVRIGDDLIMTGSAATKISYGDVTYDATFALYSVHDDNITLLVDNAGGILVTGTLTTETIQAIDGDGLFLYEDGGAGIFVEDGGNIGIGTTNPESNLHLINTSGVATRFERNVSSTASPTHRFDKSRGTVSAKTDVLAGDKLGSFQFWGYKDSDYHYAAILTGIVESTTTDNVAGYFEFSTTNNSFSYGERMRLTADGNLGIGTTAPETLLDIDGRTTTENLTIDGIGTAAESTDSALYVDTDGKVGYKYLGSCFSATKTATKFSTTGTYAKLTGWTTDIYDEHCFTWNNTNNELEIDVDGRYMIMIDVYGASTTVNLRTTLYFTVYENIAGGGFTQNTQYEWYDYITRFNVTLINEGGLSGTYVADYSDGDKIAIYVKDTGEVLDIEADDARMYVVKIK